MKLSPSAAKKLAVARDLLAVAVFIALVIGGFRAMMRSPYLQKEFLTKKETAEDVNQFFAVVLARHPTAASAIPAPVYSALKESALAEAFAKGDEFERVPVRDLAYALYRAAAALGDHNTRLRWEPRRKYKDPEKKYPPFHLVWRNGAFYAEFAAHPALRGAQILQINGKDTSLFIGPALERIAGCALPYRAAVFCRDQHFWWDFTALLSGRSALSVKVRYPDGKTEVRSAPVLSGWEFRTLSWRREKDRFSVYTQRKTAWINCGPLSYTRAERRAYRKFLSDISAQKTEDLVLDLRDSAFGDDRMSELLAGWLGSSGNRNLFSGKLWILTGPGTGGEGAALAAGLKRSVSAAVLGEEAGGNPAYAGTPAHFILGNSGIRFSVSTRLHPYPDAGGKTLAPDMPLDEALLNRFKGDIKALVLSLIEPGKAGGKR